MTEYIKLENQERNYGEKTLLQSQLGLLNTIKTLVNYKKLRNKEFVLKIGLKSKIDEARNSLLVLEKLLPRLRVSKPQSINIPEELDLGKSSSLDQELDAIKRKLASLSS